MTIRSILDVARSVFAQHGFAGTALELVEKQSGVSKGLILHHFGSKLGLYEAVLEDAAEDYTAWLKRGAAFDAPFPELMRGTIRASYRYYKAHADMRRLRAWAQLQAVPFLNDTEERFTRALVDAVARAQAAGIVRADITAVQVPFLIRAVIDYRLGNLALVRRIEREQGLKGKRAEDQFVETLCRLFLVSPAPKETNR
ncbi:MAG TPA: TetR family transcriptional regulator [Rhizomicrobium sp.]|nr:TetR family transcriptional regulator [Rhizomicrobium sp.]